MLICYLIQEAKSEKPIAKVCSLVAGSRIESPPPVVGYESYTLTD